MAELNDKAKKVFALKYSTKRTKAWKEACRDIADFMAEGERPYGKNDEQIKELEMKIVDEDIDNIKFLMYELTMMNCLLEEYESPEEEELRVYNHNEKLKQQLENRNKPDFRFLDNSELEDWERTHPNTEND